MAFGVVAVVGKFNRVVHGVSLYVEDEFVVVLWVRFYLRQITAVVGVTVYSSECDFCVRVGAVVDFLL